MTDIERQPERDAADLHVALLQHVQQRHLDACCKVGKLVHGEDAAVGARHQPEMDGFGIANVSATLGDLDRVDVADRSATAHVRRRELLAVTLARGGSSGSAAHRPCAPTRRRSACGHGRTASRRSRRPPRSREPLVEQCHRVARGPRLRLAALPEQHDARARRGGRVPAAAPPSRRIRRCRESGSRHVACGRASSRGSRSSRVDRGSRSQSDHRGWWASHGDRTSGV